VMFNRVSVDGYYAGPNGEIDWFIPDPDLDKDIHLMNRVDTTIMGRVTYQLFERYWPHIFENPSATQSDRRTAEELNQLKKIVFSKTLQTVSWENSLLMSSDPTGEVARLKRASGSDIIIFGSGTIVQQLTNAGLIDDYFIAVTPIILGVGKSLFKEADRIKLNLVSARQYTSGNALLHYQGGQ
jgi:dihydrofolate reductase